MHYVYSNKYLSSLVRQTQYSIETLLTLNDQGSILQYLKMQAKQPEASPTDQKAPDAAPIELDKNDISQDIDPDNEVQGTKLVLINIAIWLCTFLVGLVS